MSMLATTRVDHAAWLSVIIVLLLSLSACWGEGFLLSFPKPPHRQVVSKTFIKDPLTGESRTTYRYADGHEQWVYTGPRPKPEKSMLVVDADGMKMGPRKGPVDPRTVDKKLYSNRILNMEREAARNREVADRYRQYSPNAPLIGLHTRIADGMERKLDKWRQDYIKKYAELPPSIHGEGFTQELLGVGSARPLGVTGAGVFTPPDVPTGPAPGAIVRPPTPIPHID